MVASHQKFAAQLAAMSGGAQRYAFQCVQGLGQISQSRSGYTLLRAPHRVILINPLGLEVSRTFELKVAARRP
eukprot:5569791-Amphidinium_carterae.1